MKNVYYIISAILLIGCANNELDRNKAAGIIEDFYHYPIPEIITIESVKVGESVEGSENKNDQTTVHFITEAGNIIRLNEPSESSFSIIGNDLIFNEVTGIRTLESGKKAIVDYTEKRTKITSIGSQLNHQEADLVEKQLSMELYDDGWRITSESSDKGLSSDNPVATQTNEIQEKTDEETVDDEGAGDDSLGESSASFFLLKKAFTEEGEHFVAVDYIGEDGSNNNPKLRIFKIAADFNTTDTCGRYKKSGRIKSFSDLQAVKNDSLKLFIVVKNDIVQCIEFTDLPEPKPVKIEALPRRPKSDSAKRPPKDTTKRIKVDTLQERIKDTVG